MNDDPSKEAFLRAMGNMSDKLVELGYATRIHRNDTTQAVTIFWTPLGLMLQKELGRMFPKVKDGETTLNLLDCQTLLALFLMTNSGAEEGRGRG